MTGLPDEDLSDLGELPDVPNRSAGIADLVRHRVERRDAGWDGRAARAAVVEPHAPSAQETGEPAADRVAVTFYMSPGLQRRLEQYRRTHRRTIAGAVLAAIEARAETLHAVVSAARVSTSPVTGTLFPPSPSDVRYLGSGPVQVQAGLTREQDAVMDRLTTKLGVSRSSWVAAVLNDFLPGKKEQA